MTQSNNTTTNSIIKNVTLMWVHLDKPVSPFGTEQYDLRIDVPKKRAKELEAFGKVKPVMKDGKDTGMVSINLKKKAILASGEPAKKVRVVDASKNELDPKIIGNGSVGNVMVMQKPFEIKAPNGKVTKSGISTVLSAVQVVELVKYEPKGGMDFDDLSGEESDNSTSDDAF